MCCFEVHLSCNLNAMWLPASGGVDSGIQGKNLVLSMKQRNTVYSDLRAAVVFLFLSFNLRLIAGLFFSATEKAKRPYRTQPFIPGLHGRCLTFMHMPSTSCGHPHALDILVPVSDHNRKSILRYNTARLKRLAGRDIRNIKQLRDFIWETHSLLYR